MKLSTQITAILLGTSSLVFSKPIPQSDLDNVNSYIKQMMEVYAPGLTVVIANGSEDEQTGSITAIKTEVSNNPQSSDDNDRSHPEQEAITVSAGIEYQDSEFTITLGGKINGRKVGETNLVLTEVQRYIKSIEDRGFYQVKSDIHVTDANLLKALISIKPKSEQAESVKSAEIAIESNQAQETLNGEAKVVLNGEADLVQQSQAIFTTVFNKLRKNQKPSNEDLLDLIKIFQMLTEYIEDAATNDDED